jgi:hypothetical protein
MAGWNFKPNAVVKSWVTGVATTPAEKSKCVRCKTAPATCWVSFLYTSGKKGRVVEGHRATCEACNEPYAAEMNAKAEAKAAKGPKAKTEKKGRTKKATTEAKAIRSPEEQAICDKYPDRNIKPGSWLPSGGRSETHGKKATVVLVCTCGAERIVATSDIFQVKRCIACTKVAKQNKAAIKRQK